MNTIRHSGLVGVFIQRTGFVFYSLFVCLSAPSQEFEKNRLVYGLYLLLMSQKLKNIYVTNESLLQGAEKSRLISLAGPTLKKSLGELA